jgi:hypothetical protein
MHILYVIWRYIIATIEVVVVMGILGYLNELLMEFNSFLEWRKYHDR